MKINFNEIPKFVINLERRPDRLESVKKEFDYMGWNFERFNAVDTNSYEGCAYSHQEVAKIILEIIMIILKLIDYDYDYDYDT